MQCQNYGKMPRRGDIWWANLDPTAGSEISKRRPCVVISNRTVNEHRRTVVIVPLSSASHAAPPMMVRVTCSGRPAIAVIDQVRAVAKERLVCLIEQISCQELESMEDALREIVELD
jgi:mRNA interferase MazF